MREKGTIFSIHFHKWKPVRAYFRDTFLGEPFLNSYCPFRICVICGAVQELLPDSQGVCWIDLDKTKAEILWTKITDKGNEFQFEKPKL
jgi:hypothetical protein